MRIKLKNVGVTYGKTKVLRDVSFDIVPGDRVALMGATGSGKSTIAKLVGLLREPDYGQLLIDGHPSTHWNYADVLRHVGHIVQEAQLISGSVRENGLLAVHQSDLKQVTDEDVWRVCDMLSPDLRKVFGVDGLDRNVGKQGLALSGGQKQRVCIARSLIKQPHFLIVDEATSALDAITQEAVQIGMESLLHPNASALIIAHRLSTLSRCNKFIVLRPVADCEPGENQVEAIAQTMEELYEISPTFRKLRDAEKKGVAM